MQRVFRFPGVLFLALLNCVASTHGSESSARFTLKNDSVLREFDFDGHVWKTVRFARADGSDELQVRSDEFHILFLDDAELTIDQFEADGAPRWDKSKGAQQLIFHYVPRQGVTMPSNAPTGVTITYTLGKEPYLRKTVVLQMKPGTAIDRLEVERFSADKPESRGGRGEPVFVGNAWFFGVEYPAFYSRHTDGNTPKAWSGPYDRLGNYSFIDLEGRDVDSHPRPGLVRLMHFPGYAKQLSDGNWGIVGKTAVAGVGRKGDSMELVFLDYLNTIRRPVRSFIHYNNWYDNEGKRLTLENFVTNTFLSFKQNLEPYGVRIDAMVPDSGWQNRESVYEPNPTQFPHGMDDLVALSKALQANGTHLGLWIALNGYSSDIDWGKTNGYAEAERNDHFSRFRRYYSLTQSNYNAQLHRQLAELITRCQIEYFKHDFNNMCELNSGCGHLPTDRHGHEAAVDAEIDLLAEERDENKDIYQNITNWIWFSPWWLENGNNLWMLSGDSGEFRGWPELSNLIMAAAYRDVNLYPAWHDPATRPLVPISHLMTHGIIYSGRMYSRVGNSLRDFADFVMMYYMRGLQLKEWYITPRILLKEQWEALGRATRWSEENLKTLANAVLVGGDPSKGETYGYMCWNGENGILSVRNPAPGPQKISVPFDQSVWYRGPFGRAFHADVVYPYQCQWPDTFRSGAPIQLSVPGYSVLVLQFHRGRARHVTAPEFSEVHFSDNENAGQKALRVVLPNEAMQRCDLLVITKGHRPEININGQPAKPSRLTATRDWEITAFNLLPQCGKEAELSIGPGTNAADAKPEVWLLMDRPVKDTPTKADPRLPFPVAQGFRRQTVQLSF